VSADTEELNRELDLEFWFQRESRPFKLGRGSSGQQINAKECPHCGDTRWRTYLNAESGAGNCFVCNKTFSKLGFICWSLGLDPDDKRSWSQVFKHVKEVLKDQGWRPKREFSVAVEHGEVKLPTSFALPTTEGLNLQYLEDRGIDGELAKYFHLRCCSHGWWNFIKDDGTPGGQFFGDRLIIPVFDLDGTLQTFQGRDLTGDPEATKYLFPSGLPGTGRFILNGQNAIRSKRIAMGEGAFDVMAMKKAFDEEVAFRDIVPVGSFGKHLSYGSTDGNDQLGRLLQLKKQGLEEVVIMWDGEWKALISALEAAELMTSNAIHTRIALLPKDKDPNEVAGAVVRAAYTNAVPWSRTLAVRWRLTNPFAKA
jgi:DNA primase